MGEGTTQLDCWDARRGDSRPDSVYERAYLWLQDAYGGAGLPELGAGAEDLLATCLCLLMLEGLGRLQDVDQERRLDLGSYLQACQQSDTGLFAMPARGQAALPGAPSDEGYQAHLTTYLALQAMDALGLRPSHPLRFVAELSTRQTVDDWLQGLDWSNPRPQAERVMFVLAFLVYQAEVERDASAPALFHQVLDWLDRNQDPKTGMWGTQLQAPLAEAIAAAYHLVPYYEYVQRPLVGITKITNAALRLQQQNGLFATGDAYQDLAAIGLLATFTRQVSYRRDDIRRALLRVREAISSAENPDGGWTAATEPTLSTWLRLAALAIIDSTYPPDLPQAKPWQFRRWPALGYHRTRSGLSEHERAVLPLWLRPTSHPKVQDAGERPAISVVIPCFNLGRYLHEAHESVLAQTCQAFEIVVVDDGSTDELTQLVLANFARPKTRVIRQRNGGLAVARNHGIREAKGRYICSLDADDRLRPEFFAKAFPILETESDVGLVSGYFQDFDAWDEVIQHNTCTLPEMLGDNKVMAPALFRREAWERAGGHCETFSIHGSEDWDMWISILEMGYRAAVVPEVLYEYRIRPDSMSANMLRPQNWRRLLEELVARHEASYQKHVGYLLPLSAARYYELKEWTDELQRGKEWLEEQWQIWRRIAEERSASITEQGPQGSHRQRLAEERENELAYLRSNLWVRVGQRLGMVKGR